MVVRQSRRSFVERVDFVTSVGFGDGPGSRQRLGLTGAGPRKVITDLGVLEPDPATCEFMLTGVYPGVTVADVKGKTGWQVSARLAEVLAAGPGELSALRAAAGPRASPGGLMSQLHGRDMRRTCDRRSRAHDHGPSRPPG